MKNKGGLVFLNITLKFLVIIVIIITNISKIFLSFKILIFHHKKMTQFSNILLRSIIKKIDY